jgi:hypothetical protein
VIDCIWGWDYSYLSSVVPIGATFAMTLWLGNTSYLYISVSFAQMLKAISKLVFH